ncbi:MAG: hypothetical protein RJB38_1465 [Pseudomonadota bacterium]|jgi:hypothetical protein
MSLSRAYGSLLGLAVWSVALGSFARASTVTTTFTNDDFVVCNAGIWRDPVAISKDASLVATPGASSIVPDSIAVTFEDLTVPETSPTRIQKATVSPTSSGGLRSLFPSGSFTVNQKITRLTTSLGSMHFGTGWFIDFCYVGPAAQVSSGADLSEGNYSLDVALSGGSSWAPYLQAAGVQAQMSFECDLRAKGVAVGPAGAEVAGSGFTPEVDVAGLSTAQFIPSTVMTSWNYLLNSNGLQVPRACRVRLLMTEKATTVERTWEVQDTSFQLDISIQK